MSDEESLSSGGGKRWRADTRTYSRVQRESVTPQHDSVTSQGDAPHCVTPQGDAPDCVTPLRDSLTSLRDKLKRHRAALALPQDPTVWTEEDVSALVSRVAGAGAGEAAAAARVRGAELLMTSRDELVACLRLRLGPAVKLYAAVTELRHLCS